MKLDRYCTGVFCTVALALPLFLPVQLAAMQDQGNQPTRRPPNARGGRPAILEGWGGGDAASEREAIRDQAFAENAVEGGLAEVRLGVLATQKGASEDVKSFGQKMVQDHMMLNAGMEPIAEAMEVKIPYQLNPKDMAEYDRLNALSGEAFDKAYLNAMVEDHHKDLQEFQQENATVKNPALKAAVDKGEKVIQEHTQMVDQLAKSKGMTIPGV